MQLHDRAPDAQARAAAREQLGLGIERASHLVDQLLTLARSDPGAAERQPISVRLDDTARLAVSDVAALANARGVDLGLASAQAATLSGDPEALRILVRNLIDNAVRYTPGGGRVDVHVRSGQATTILEVIDTGPGIPAAEREQVFARFYRSDDSDAGGSGLGLAIVKAIADRHGGRVELEDAPGHGLLVRVTFPAGSV